MSSDSWMPAVRTTNVAARIQAFQNVQALQSHASSGPARRVITQAFESGTTVGRGKRSNSSFASPAGRASRDGNEGVRGDGRPPVADFSPSIHPATEESELPKRPQSQSAVRPQVSVRQPSNEVSKMRLRLRPVTEAKKEEDISETEHVEEESKGRHNTGTARKKSKVEKALEELGDLLDNAIEEAGGGHPSVPSEMASPQGPRRSKSVRSSREAPDQSTAVRRARSVEHRRELEVETSQHPTEPIHMDHIEKMSPNKIDPGKHHDVQERETPSQGLHVPITTYRPKGPSPVKERAAMFERMVRKSSSPKAVHTPPIQLALPRLLSPRPRPRSQLATHSSFVAEEEFITAPQTRSDRSILPPSEQRRSSSVWPFKWGMLSKTHAASPQQTDIEAPGSKHHDSQRESKVSIRSKVQHLVEAANKSSQVEQTQLRSKQERKRGSSKETAVDRESAFSLKSPAKEQPSRPETPRSPAPEKEVLPQLGGCPYPIALRSGSHSPVKRDPPVPSTPLRGRQAVNPRSPGGNSYAVEQRFALSRSRSRGGGVRIQVEVRTSPERTSEDAVVVVRADVEPIEKQAEV